MTCTLVLPDQWLVLDIAQLRGITMLHVQHVGQLIELLLRNLTLIDDDGIVHIATLDEVRLQQGLNVAYKDEGACCCYF